MLNRRSLIKCCLLGALASCIAASTFAGDVPGAMPEKLKVWKCADYTRRFYITVEAPGEAGSAGLHPDTAFASVSLPIKLIGEGAAAHPEPLLLISEDGSSQPIFTHTVPGGSDTEIVFPTHPGLRRFCLYTSVSKVPGEVSPLSLRPTPLQVHLKGLTADATFKYTPGNPLTLKRFEQMETQGAPLPPPRSLANPDPHPEVQTNIDDAECPYFGIQYTIFDVIRAPTDIYNPQNYAAIYEGFLRCPVAGKYKFAIDTPGAAHLVIDGVPVLAAEIPDDHREAFAINKTIDLTEGVHRVVVHYAEAVTNNGPKKTNEDLRRFGVRLHWQPPFASGLVCIPPLAFVKYLPGVVAACENAPGTALPFIHVETLGHVRISAQRGDNAAKEWVLICARAVGLPADAGWFVSAAQGMPSAIGGKDQSRVCTWVPAGVPIDFSIPHNDTLDREKNIPVLIRTATWPTLKTGLKESVEKEVMDLEAELLVKSAPTFLYPNETGHIHVETVLTPKPVIVHKTRFDAKDLIGWEMLPPPPRPMGEFMLYFSGAGIAKTESYPATPDESERRKLRVSFPANLDEAMKGTGEMALRLVVGGLDCQRETFRVLHAQAPTWPGKLTLVGGELRFNPNNAQGENPLEHVIILVPHEDEASHRRLKPLDSFASSDTSGEALFIGDSLVEGAKPAEKNAPANGLAAALAKAKSGLTWKAIDVSGPHRYRPVLKMLADLDAYVSSAPGVKLPKTAVVNLGSGDVSRQTALYTFERALDTLLNRLTAGGVEHIIVVGVIPEAWRDRQCEPYQDRVDNVVKQHHVSGINIFNTWTREENWAKHFVPDGENSDIAGPVPNAAGIDEIVHLILSRL